MVHKFPLKKVVNHGIIGKPFNIKKTNSHLLSNHEHAANKKLTHVNTKTAAPHNMALFFAIQQHYVV